MIPHKIIFLIDLLNFQERSNNHAKRHTACTSPNKAIDGAIHHLIINSLNSRYRTHKLIVHETTKAQPNYGKGRLRKELLL